MPPLSLLHFLHADNVIQTVSLAPPISSGVKWSTGQLDLAHRLSAIHTLAAVSDPYLLLDGARDVVAELTVERLLQRSVDQNLGVVRSLEPV